MQPFAQLQALIIRVIVVIIIAARGHVGKR